jgi:hypothetical protein
MAELRRFGRFGPRITFKCNEGNITIGTLNRATGDMEGPVFASPIADKDWVKLTGNMTISKCAASDPEVLGQVVGTPEFKGQEPVEAVNWGSYEPRRVTVELMGSKVEMVQLEANNSLIGYGDSVAVGASTAQCWDLDSTANHTYVLSGAALNAGTKIPVLFGYYGAF